MKHYIFYEILTALECPYRFLFWKPCIEPLKERGEFKYSNIYFFTVAKKIRFVKNSIKLINKRTIQCKLQIGNEKVIDFQDSLFNVAHIIKEIFETEENYKKLWRDEDDFWRCEIDYSQTTHDRAHMILKTVTEKEFDFWICPENIEDTKVFDSISLDECKPKVVYVGQSFRMLDRITSHKTLHKAVSELQDDEDLKIFFLTFKYGYGGDRDFVNIDSSVADIWLSEHGKSEEFKSKINLVERFLIHYLQPKYNTQHIKTDVQNDELVKKLLIENKIDVLTINIGVHGRKFEFWTENQKLQTDFCSFNFLEPEKGYQKNVIKR